MRSSEANWQGAATVYQQHSSISLPWLSNTQTQALTGTR